MRGKLIGYLVHLEGKVLLGKIQIVSQSAGSFYEVSLRDFM